MEKLWKSYGISFLGICTNPVNGYENYIPYNSCLTMFHCITDEEWGKA